MKIAGNPLTRPKAFRLEDEYHLVSRIVFGVLARVPSGSSHVVPARYVVTMCRNLYHFEDGGEEAEFAL